MSLSPPCKCGCFQKPEGMYCNLYPGVTSTWELTYMDAEKQISVLWKRSTCCYPHSGTSSALPFCFTRNFLLDHQPAPSHNMVTSQLIMNTWLSFGSFCNLIFFIYLLPQCFWPFFPPVYFTVRVSCDSRLESTRLLASGVSPYFFLFSSPIFSPLFSPVCSLCPATPAIPLLLSYW